MQTAIDQLVNHISLVLDCSTSMRSHERKVREVAKSEIANMAKLSQDMNQDTRISVYSFSDSVKCLIYDKDVLRLPDIDTLYSIGGNTALIDATLQSVEDLRELPTKYGDHAFFNIVVTDGEENRSRRPIHELVSTMRNLPDNWTMATMVPNRSAIQCAMRYGFSENNCAVWDTTSVKGFDRAADTIRSATTNFYTSRASGVRGSKNIFQVDTRNLNKSVVQTSLLPVPPGKFNIYPVSEKIRIDDFMNKTPDGFELGRCYYELTKKEEVQAHKQICVVDKVTKGVYTGPNARILIGLPNETVQVEPTYNPNYDIFIQSTAPNRNLMPNTKVLVMR